MDCDGEAIDFPGLRGRSIGFVDSLVKNARIDTVDLQRSMFPQEKTS